MKISKAFVLVGCFYALFVILISLLPVPGATHLVVRQITTKNLSEVQKDSIFYIIEGEKDNLGTILNRIATESYRKIDLRKRTKEMYGAKSEDDPFLSYRTTQEGPSQRYNSYINFEIEGDEPIGIIKIRIFADFTPAVFEYLLNKLNELGIKKLIVDLRGNNGLNTDTVLQILFLFMKDSDIAATIRTRYTEAKLDARYLSRQYKRPISDKFRNFEILILVNGKTMSSAELFAGAMKSFGYTLMGEKTFGKGLGQNYFILPSGSKLFLTTFEFFPGNHRMKVDGVGVEPDIVIADIPETKEDEQLEAAIKFLQDNPQRN